MKQLWASITKILIAAFNNIIAFRAKTDSFLRKFTDNFNASIQIKTRDNLFNGYILFRGRRGVKYSNGIIDNPTSTVLYRSVKDLFIFCLKYADINEALIENRFTMFGNLNVLFKYGFIANYINPMVKKIK